MSQQQFKIPASLDVSYFDMEFSLKNKDGLGAKNPVSLKVIVAVLMFMFGWFYLLFQTFIGSGGIFVSVGFSIAWVILAIILCKSDKTGRMGIQLMMSMINYLPRTGRETKTRQNDSVHPLKVTLNLKDVDESDGMLHFYDGAIGYVYHIVGTASILMFDADKVYIMDEVDKHYRKFPVGVEVIYDTIYEGHQVDEQLESLNKDRNELRVKSKGLATLMQEQEDVLHAITQGVGLTSLHQYLIVRAQNINQFREFESLLFSGIQGNAAMIRLAEPLDYKATERFLTHFVGTADTKAR